VKHEAPGLCLSLMIPVIPADSSGIGMLPSKTLQMGDHKGVSVNLRGSPE
jgi:hypothetical protein